MKRVPFQQVDVFTAVPFKGNPVAVVLDGNGLQTEQMQTIANWTNLSETTFVCAPTNPAADYRLRIFTPKSELNFAGHPTLGSAHAVVRNGLIPKTAGRLVQECRHGLIPLALDGERIFLMVPQPRLSEVPNDTLAEIGRALGIESGAIRAAASVDVSITWIDDQRTDLLRILQTDVLPCFPRINRFVNASAISRVATYSRFSSAGVNHIMIGL